MYITQARIRKKNWTGKHLKNILFGNKHKLLNISGNFTIKLSKHQRKITSFMRSFLELERIFDIQLRKRPLYSLYFALRNKMSRLIPNPLKRLPRKREYSSKLTKGIVNKSHQNASKRAFQAHIFRIFMSRIS